MEYGLYSRVKEKGTRSLVIWRKGFLMKIIIAEKPSVGRTYAQVLGVHNKEDGYMESDEWIVTWSALYRARIPFSDSMSRRLCR